MLAGLAIARTPFKERLRIEPGLAPPFMTRNVILRGIWNLRRDSARIWTIQDIWSKHDFFDVSVFTHRDSCPKAWRHFVLSVRKGVLISRGFGVLGYPL